MKKIIFSLALCIAICSCNSGGSNNAGSDSGTNKEPITIQDSGTQHPNGVTSDGVISTDTSAFGVKASSDSANKK